MPRHNEPRPYDLIIFDWDGTLMDSAQHIVSNMLQAIETLGLPRREPEQISELIGLGLQDAFKRLYADLHPQHAMGLLEQYRSGFVKVSQDRSMLFAGVIETLDRLRSAGYDLAVATGKSRAGLDRALRETGLADHFVMTRCADESANKPHPQMLLDILQAADLAPQRALMVGDTEYDIQMASGAKMSALGVDCGVHETGRLHQAGAVCVLPDVRALPDWLASQLTDNV